MAPEQADGSEAGPAADLYSLALTLYEGLAGRNPLRGETVAATARLVGGPVPPLARVRGDLDPRAVRRDRPRALPGAASRAARSRDCRPRSITRSTPPAAPPPQVDPGVTVADGGGVLLAPDGGHTVRVATPAVAAPASAASRSRAAGARSRPRAPRRPAVRPGARRLRRAHAAWRARSRPGRCAARRCHCSPGNTTARRPPSALRRSPRSSRRSRRASAWLLLGLGAIAWLGAIGHPGAALMLAAALAAGRGVARAAPLAVVGVRGGTGARRRSASARRRRRLPAGSAAAFARVPRWVRSPIGGWRSPRCSAAGACVLGQPSGVRALASWQGSISGALHHALIPMCSDPRLWASAGLWGLAAAVLPWIVRGPLSPERAIAAAVWAAALTVGGDRDRRAPGHAATAAPAGVLGARDGARRGRAARSPALAPTGGRPVAWTRSRGPCEQTTPRNDERPPQPRDQDRRPRRGGVRPGFPQRDHAGRAGAPARSRDGSPPSGLVLRARRSPTST